MAKIDISKFTLAEIELARKSKLENELPDLINEVVNAEKELIDAIKKVREVDPSWKLNNHKVKVFLKGNPKSKKGVMGAKLGMGKDVLSDVLNELKTAGEVQTDGEKSQMTYSLTNTD